MTFATNYSPLLSVIFPLILRFDAATIAVAALGTCSASSNSNACTAPPQPECGLYMAPSTLGEDANLGMYAGRDIPTNFTWHEMAIPLLFREWGDHKPGYRDGILWDRYIWEGDIMNIETYQDTNREKSRAVFVPGIGCTVNSLLDMNNILSTHGSTYDTVDLHRSKDPGVTAFTPYHSAQTRAVRDIEAGTELMAMYGDFWIPDIPNVQVTLDYELEQAELFLQQRYLPWITKHKPSASLQHGLWELMKSFPYQRNNRALSNLPRTDWKHVIDYYLQQQQNKSKDKDNTEDKDKTIVRHFIRQSTKRSIEWLQENGYCQDHMEAKPSTIPQAGRGAFATRALPQGTIVGYSPLVHIGTQGQEVLWLGDRYDLVINYSYQHANSTVLLTPYGGMVNYINHAFDKSRVNVRVQWLRREFVAHKPHWLQQTAEFLHDTIDKIGLSFEYVAVRDIEPGEEILMDYGSAWEQAWEYYAAQYSPVTDPYVARAQWNETHYRTPEEEPYPDNLMTMCHESYSSTVVLEDDEDPEEGYVWVPMLRPEDPHRVYCTVLERFSISHDKRDGDDREASFEYTVELHLKDRDEPVIVRHVPEDGIFLYDRAFSQDWHLPGGFRHPIALPDDMLPPSWVNVVHE
ncbi:hypothetical protein FisN_19Lh017 [Fistulifera solaris]|uniref:SET domain-containing protein n=1 Tax=Fistulifera solaris TaxID=1519565 RepID=A0A1Z5JR56_FISSO|nr:hypothetical protein FisN_19Lh017 [Fistulifera solaris]|eukprot:GAX16439.1 hypothetical protein FisN_19Lh017 [Fistulifera solaris]